MLARAIVASLLILGASFAIQRASGAESVPPRVPLAALPLDLGDWRGRDLPAWDDRVLEVLGADDYVNRRYVNDRSVADLCLGYYRSQQQGDSIHSPQNCLPGAGWQPVENDRVTIRVSPDRSITVNKYIIQKDLDRQVVLYWFQGRGRVVANEYANRAYLVFDSLRTRRSDGALVRVMSPVFETTERSNADAAAFAAALHPQLSEVIP